MDLLNDFIRHLRRSGDAQGGSGWSLSAPSMVRLDVEDVKKAPDSLLAGKKAKFARVA